METVSAPAAKARAAPPFRIASGLTKAPANQRLPPDIESQNSYPTIVPQLLVGAAYWIAELFDESPDVPMEAAVVPAPCVPDQFTREAAIGTRA